MGIPIMTEQWIVKCWEHRNDISKRATDDFFTVGRVCLSL